MKVGIIGIGYIGTIMSAYSTELGHETYIHDINKEKLINLKDNRPDIYEPGVNELLAKNNKRIIISENIVNLASCEIIFICVSTPNTKDGSLNTEYVEDVISKLSLIEFDQRVEVVVRSTMPIGSASSIFSRYKNKNVAYGLNPEFLREGEALHDLENPPTIPISAYSLKLVNTEKFYQHQRELIRNVEISTAEMIKLVSNTWHALKIAFANDVAEVSINNGGNPDELFNLFIEDKYLNISEHYLRPGYPYGGSCLPKDTLGLAALSIGSPLLSSINSSNLRQIDNIINDCTPYNTIGIIGLSFKKGTDDLRFSVAYDVTKRLVKLGKKVVVHDELIDVSSLGFSKGSVDEISEQSEIILDFYNHKTTIKTPC